MDFNFDILIYVVDFEIAISFDGDVHFRKFFHRWKALTLSYPLGEKLSKTDITIKSYGRFESTP